MASYIPLVKELGNQAYPILAEKWQSILEIGIPPYQENGDLSIDENDGSDDDVDIEAIDSLNKINISVFEEQPENLTNSRPTAKDISALRKWRSWATVETDKRRDIQTPDESLPSHAVNPWLSTAGIGSFSGRGIKHWLSASIESLRQQSWRAAAPIPSNPPSTSSCDLCINFDSTPSN